ncbi:MAG: polysaccharide deacetylase family protein [Niabella sp.]
MLNFRTTNIVFFILLTVLIAIQYFYGFDVSWFIALGLLYTAVLFYGSFYIYSNFFIKTHCGVKTNEKIIVLSFDDGPSTEYTQKILQILQEQQVPATFFLIGKNIQASPELVHEIVSNGHLIGNHSYEHSNWFDLQSSKNMIAELQQTHNLVHQLTGKHLKWFRPPYGVTNPNVKKAVAALNYQTIGWNVRSLDTMIKEPAKLLDRLKGMIKPGAIVLLHDTQEITTHILPDFLQYIKEQGYVIVPLDKLLHLQPYA